MGEDSDGAEIWGRRAGRVLAFAVALWLAYEIGQYLKLW